MEQDRLQPDYCPTCRSTTQYEMIKIIESFPGRRIEHRRCDRCHNDYCIDVFPPLAPIDFRGLKNE